MALTASIIMNSNPTSPIGQVNFYLQNPDLSLTLLGSASTSINGAWSITFSEDAYGLAPGNTYTFVAQAADSSVPAVLSDPVSVSLQVL